MRDVDIVGVGIDVIEIRVVARMIEEMGDRFLRLALREGELERLPEGPGRPMAVSRTLAAKEAAMKAVGLGLGPTTTWRSFEVIDRPGSLVLLWLRPEGADVEFRAGVSRSADTVIATAWALRGG